MLEMRTDDEKVRYYKKFWNREDVTRPLVGFDIGGFFSLRRFPALGKLKDGDVLLPEFIVPAEYLDAYESFRHRSAEVVDDLIKGVAPIPAIPWIEAMLGCQIRISQESASIWAEERHAAWDELEDLHIADENPWFLKYLEFLAELTHHADGRYPVGQPFFRGITDLLGALRGHDQALIDGLEEPALIQQLAQHCADALIKVTQKQYGVIEPYQGGYYIEQFSLWSPDMTARLQEDTSAIYSPRLYRNLIQENDRRIAAAFPCSLIHLHSSSLFLLDDFLAIKEIGVFEVNKDVGGLFIQEMLPWLKKIQECDRCLVIRGMLTPEDVRLIANHLASRGLLVQIVVDTVESVEEYQAAIQTYW